MKLTDRELHAEIILIRKHERDISIKLLDHLQEVFDRRLFADFGHSSLIRYMVKELGYSESAAFRRQQTLKLSYEVPEVRGLIQSGGLNITSAALIQGGLRNTKEKVDMVKRSHDKTSMEIKDLIVEVNPELKKRDIINPVSGTESRVHLTLSKETLKKIEKLRSISKKKSNDDVISLALDIALKSLDISEKKSNKVKYIAVKNVPRSTVKKLKMRSSSRCEFEGCDEEFNLEIEHIIPRAKGGGHDLANLKLFCRAHNQRAAIKEFGMDVMGKYLNKKRPLNVSDPYSH
jgi:hypothetical protein